MDKCGIYACLHALLELDNIKVALFSNEEVGCIGSGQADMNFFKDCSVVIQLDRKNNKSLITKASGVELCSKEFIDTIQHVMDEYQYSTYDGGLITDVKALKTKGLDVNCFNLECGYYAPHTDQEVVVLTDLQYALSFAIEVMNTMSLVDEKMVHEYVKPVYKPVVQSKYPSYSERMYPRVEEKEFSYPPSSFSSLSTKATIGGYRQQELPFEEMEIFSQEEEYLEEIDTYVQDLMGLLDDWKTFRDLKKEGEGRI